MLQAQLEQLLPAINRERKEDEFINLIMAMINLTYAHKKTFIQRHVCALQLLLTRVKWNAMHWEKEDEKKEAIWKVIV